MTLSDHLDKQAEGLGGIRSSLCGSLLKTTVEVFFFFIVSVSAEQIPISEGGEWGLLGKGPQRWCLALPSCPQSYGCKVGPGLKL